MEIKRLKQRQGGIGGSDAGVILGLSKWKTPMQLWMEKTNQGPCDQPDTPAMEWGRRLEEVVARAVAERLHCRVRRGGAMRRHPKLKWMIGNLDYLTNKGQILEIKTTLRRSEDWGEDGTEDVPPHYAAQVLHYMCITSSPSALLAVLFLVERSLGIYEFHRDEETENVLIAAERSFWENNVLKRIPPKPLTSDDVMIRWPKPRDKAAVASLEIDAKISQMHSRMERIRVLENELQGMKEEVKLYMADRERLESPNGRLLATWKQQKGRTDWETVARRVAEDQDAVAREAQLHVSSSRVFRLKNPWEG